MNWQNRHFMGLRVVTWPLMCVSLGSALAASDLSDASLAEIKFDQKPGNQITLNLQFLDESGRTVQLRDCFGRKPAILVLGYYGCPMLCTLVLNGMVESLQDLKGDIGNQFEIINVSIDPSERPELAAAKKRTYLKRYGRPGAANGWHFLTGDESAISQLASEVGFHYAYDSSSKQYAHPSGLIILTPDGKVARYFFGVTYSPSELDAALKEAGARHTGSPIEQFILLCFHYSPLKGKYSQTIMTAVRVAGLVTLAGLIGVTIVSRRWGTRTARKASR